METNVGELQVIRATEKREEVAARAGREKRCSGSEGYEHRGAVRARARAPCDSYNIVIAMTVITSRKVFLHNQHYSQFRGEWAAGNARLKIETTVVLDNGDGDGGGGSV